MTGVDILRAMMTYIWPKGNPGLKLRVLTSLSLLVGAKVSEVQTTYRERRKVKYSTDYMDENDKQNPKLFLLPSERILGFRNSGWQP